MSKPRTISSSVYSGLSPLAADLLRQSARAFDAQQWDGVERRRVARRLEAAKAGLAQNPTWGETVLASGAL